MSEQNYKENINKNIDTNTFIIHWKMRNGKTLLALLIWYESYQKRIYSNFEIYKNWKSILNKHIKSFNDLKNIRFSYTPWVLIIDEAWLNVNSKDGRNEESRFMEEVLFLIGKKNLSLIRIAQRFNSINVNWRELVDYIFKSKKIDRWPDQPPLFIITSQRQKGSKLLNLYSWTLESVKIMKEYWLSYNQLESSKMEKF